MRLLTCVAVLALAACQPAAPPAPEAPAAPSAPAIPPAPEGNTPSPGDIISASKPEEWRVLDPENTLYMDFPSQNGKGGGRVIIEMAPEFSPNHVANVKALSREVDRAGTDIGDRDAQLLLRVGQDGLGGGQ